jgi:hypothetical protein
MSKLLAILGLVSSVAWCAQAPRPRRPAVSVTVLLDFDHPHSDVSVLVMEQEASSLLRDTGVQIDWRMRSTVSAGEEFADLVSLHVRGSCSMDTEPLSVDEGGPLAKAYAANGVVLHFGEVECDRVKAVLLRTIEGSPCWRPDFVLGRALGRVVAHEMYHILGNEMGHTQDGVTRKNLTGRDLAGDAAFFPSKASQRVSQQFGAD